MDNQKITATTPNPPTPRLTAHQVAEILCQEAWQGRWNPLNQGRNTRPMAEHAAQVLTEALHRLGFAIVPDPDENGSYSTGEKEE